jgi:high-affinity K+ transport system ATPase subunit B
MRWILLLLAAGAFALAFSTKSTGLMGFCLVVGIVLLFVVLFAFAAAKIEATSRPDAALLTDKDINTIRASVRKAKAAATPAPPPPADE